jgi:hypothetical protein
MYRIEWKTIIHCDPHDTLKMLGLKVEDLERGNAASGMPWKKDLLATLLSFCPIVTQNPSLTLGVSVSPHLPVEARVGLLSCFLWAVRVQDSHGMYLIYFCTPNKMPQRPNSSSSVPSDTFLTIPPKL